MFFFSLSICAQWSSFKVPVKTSPEVSENIELLTLYVVSKDIGIKLCHTVNNQFNLVQWMNKMSTVKLTKELFHLTVYNNDHTGQQIF